MLTQSTLERKVKPIKRRDMGIAGAIIILAQVLSSTQSAQNLSKEIAELKRDIEASNLEREQYFVRKTEIFSLTRKLDRVSDQVTSLKIAVYNRNHLDEANIGLRLCGPFSYQLQGRKLKYD